MPIPPILGVPRARVFGRVFHFENRTGPTCLFLSRKVPSFPDYGHLQAIWGSKGTVPP